jgi:hypothetical protein
MTAKLYAKMVKLSDMYKFNHIVGILEDGRGYK